MNLMMIKNSPLDVLPRLILACLILATMSFWSMDAEATAGEPDVINILGIDERDGKLYWEVNSGHYMKTHYVFLDRPERIATVTSWGHDLGEVYAERRKRLIQRLRPLNEIPPTGLTFSQTVTEAGETPDWLDMEIPYFMVELQVSGEALAKPVSATIRTVYDPAVSLHQVFTDRDRKYVFLVFRYTGIAMEGGYTVDKLFIGRHSEN